MSTKKEKARAERRRFGFFQKCKNLVKSKEEGKTVYWCSEERMCIDEEENTGECPEDCEFLDEGG